MASNRNCRYDGKNRSSLSPTRSIAEMNGRDVQDIRKTIGEIDPTAPAEKWLTKLKKSKRFFGSTSTASGELELVSTSGFRGIVTRSALHQQVLSSA